MTTLNVDLDVAVGAHLIAGRKAAYSAMLVAAHETQMTIKGVSDEVYNGVEHISIGNFDLRPAIDAAVLETIVRLNHPDQIAPTPAPRRRWWQRIFRTRAR